MTPEHIDKLHLLLDTVDGRICEELQLRARLVREIAAWDHTTGQRLGDARRESQVQAAIRKARGEGYDDAALQRIFQVILEESRHLASTDRSG